MFKMLKYFFVISLYKKAKNQFVILVISLITILLSSLIISDVMTFASGLNPYVLIVLKWCINLSMILLIALTLLKIIKLATPTPIIIKPKKQVRMAKRAANKKKETTLKQDKLFTESEMILQKYAKCTK